MTSQPNTLAAFIDGASASVARAIASVQREAARERELRDAQFAARMAELDARMAAVTELERRVADKLATVRDGDPGRSVTVEEVAPLIEAEIARRFAAVPMPDVDAMVRSAVAEAVAALPPAQPGRDADPVQVAELVRAEAERILAAWERPKDGNSVTVEELAPVVAEAVQRAVAALPAPKDGEPGRDGAPGKLPIVRAWIDTVHYEGDVVAHDGSTYQAVRDTGRAPPHEDWICLASAGRNGDNGRSPKVRETYAEGVEYAELDIVALNGAAFIARHDNPGPCPGDGWQMIAMQGRQGKPGERGPSIKGDRGPPGPGLSEMSIDGNGLLTARNADGSRVECDLYPLLSRLG